MVYDTSSPIMRVYNALKLIKNFSINLDTNSKLNTYSKIKEREQYNKRKYEIYYKERPVVRLIDRLCKWPFSPIRYENDGDVFDIKSFNTLVEVIENVANEMMRFIPRKYLDNKPILPNNESQEDKRLEREKITFKYSIQYNTLSKPGILDHLQREMDRKAGIKSNIPMPKNDSEIWDTKEALRVLEDKKTYMKELVNWVEQFGRLSKQACDALSLKVDSFGLFVLLEGKMDGILLWSPCDANELKIDEMVSKYIEWPMSILNPCFMGIRTLEVMSVENALSTHSGKTYFELWKSRGEKYLNSADRINHATLLTQNPNYVYVHKNNMLAVKPNVSRETLNSHTVVDSWKDYKASDETRIKERIAERMKKPNTKLDENVVEYTLLESEDGSVTVHKNRNVNGLRDRMQKMEKKESSVARGTVGI